MIIQAFTHAILSAAVIASPFQAIHPDLIPKQGVAQQSMADLVSTEKHWNFAIDHYRMQHHHGLQTLNITVDCTADAIDFSPKLSAINGEISQFLSRYPNEDDYWEIINRELAKTILHNHPELSSISITLEVLPTARLPYTRASIVSQSRTGERLEEWRFASRMPVQVQGDNLNYEVEYLYRNGITDTEYPNFVPISDRIAQLLLNAVSKGEPWSYANQDIAATMMQKYPVLDAFTSHVENTMKGLPESETKSAIHY